ERVADDDVRPGARERLREVVGVLDAPPGLGWRGGPAEAGQVHGERVGAGDDVGEVVPRAAPPVQGEDAGGLASCAVREHVTRQDRQHADEVSTGARGPTLRRMTPSDHPALATVAVTAGRPDRAPGAPVNPGVVLSSTYV